MYIQIKRVPSGVAIVADPEFTADTFKEIFEKVIKQITFKSDNNKLIVSVDKKDEEKVHAFIYKWITLLLMDPNTKAMSPRNPDDVVNSYSMAFQENDLVYDNVFPYSSEIIPDSTNSEWIQFTLNVGETTAVMKENKMGAEVRSHAELTSDAALEKWRLDHNELPMTVPFNEASFCVMVSSDEQLLYYHRTKQDAMKRYDFYRNKGIRNTNCDVAISEIIRKVKLRID